MSYIAGDSARATMEPGAYAGDRRWCPKHGDVGCAKVHFEIGVWSGEYSRMQRTYCMVCLFEALDGIGVKELQRLEKL